MANILGMMFGVLSAAVQARVLGPVGRGELATAIVPGTLLAMLLCLGLPDYFARKAARDGEGGSASKLALILSVAIGCVVIWPYMLCIEYLAPPASDSWWLLRLYGFLTPAFVYGYCLVAISMGASQWRLVVMSKIVPQVVTVCGLLLMAAWEPTVGAVGLLLVTSAVTGLLLPLCSTAVRPSGHIVAQDGRDALAFGIKGWTAGALALLNQRIDLLLLTAIANKTDLGYYAIATTVASVINALSTAIGIPARNRVAKGDAGQTVNTVAVVLGLTSIVGICLGSVLPWLVPLVLGDEFVPAIPVMWVLIAAQIPLGGVVILTLCLVASGRPSTPLVGEAIALAFTTVAVLVAYPTFGLLAAALANFGGNILSLGALLFMAKRHLSSAPLWHYFILSPRRLQLVLRPLEA